MSFEIAKAGWLYRQSSILRQWKRNWFVLYLDGMIKYFESENSHVAEKAESLPSQLLAIKNGRQITGVTPPPNLTADSLLRLVFRSAEWTLCAESPDDMRAWQIALEQARVIHHATRQDVPPPYSATAAASQAYVGQPPVAPSYPIPPYQDQSYHIGSNPAQVYAGSPYAYGPQPQTYVVPGNTTTVIYADGPGRYYDPYCRRGYYSGTDVAVGMLAGVAIADLMWSPCLFW